ncbi:MAG: AEC family transporter [Hyphomicrobiales bacterium]|nr:AEC family transporter [Hyphomicrobiales bacterium]
MALGALFPGLARVLDLALPFFGLIALGYACGKIFDFGEGGLAFVNVFIVYIALPSLFFVLISKTPLEKLSHPLFVLCTTAATATAFAIAFGIGFYARRNVPEATIEAMIGAYSNIGYMGPGLTLAALGPQAAGPTALIFLGDTVFLFAALPLMMALGHRGNQGFGAIVWLIVKRIVTHPFNIAVAVAVLAAAFSLRPPQAIGRMIELLSGAAAPTALFALGATMAMRPARALAPETPFLLGVKLIIHPMIAYAYLTLAGVDKLWVLTALLMASLPPALNVFVMASQYRVYVEQASGAILAGTLASVVTVTTLLWLIVG